MRTCPDCGVDISEMHHSAKRCVDCAETGERRVKDAYYRQMKEDGVPHIAGIRKTKTLDRVCPVCDENVQHYLDDARICLTCRIKTLRRCGHLADGATGHPTYDKDDYMFTPAERKRMGVGNPDSCIIEFPDIFDDMDAQFSLNFFGGE